MVRGEPGEGCRVRTYMSDGWEGRMLHVEA